MLPGEHATVFSRCACCGESGFKFRDRQQALRYALLGGMGGTTGTDRITV
jgi:hypothetical protein